MGRRSSGKAVERGVDGEEKKQKDGRRWRASGVGECSAKLFAEHGAKIVIADIQDQLGQAVCEAICLSNSIYVHCDVTNEEDVQ
ncbi:hypothetical protein E3N88_14628 [Mikania micrantha]|uniref:Uncharacterized protein n=1 Tax=Mikania micrantha TaxID=192012 RepID=A0A5N6P386_9ASTR|nr:hypothetical protein E3N88_14628 [Mikania micrantha]